MIRPAYIALLLAVMLIFTYKKNHAQIREDSLKVRPLTPPHTLPSSPLPLSNDNLLVKPQLLGIDGLSFSTSPELEKEIPSDLSIQHFFRYYYKDFLKWEKERYGGIIDLTKFTKRQNIREDVLQKPKSGPPNPLHPHFQQLVDRPWGIKINWPLTKAELWYRKNFDFEDRTFGILFLIDTMGLTTPKIEWEVNLLDSMRTFSNTVQETMSLPPLTNKDRGKSIDRIRDSIRQQARKEIQPARKEE